MKPIRQAELDHYKDQIDSKFRSKASAIDSEIQSQAQDLSDKKKSTFSKACKVDKKLSILIEAEKKSKAYILNKDRAEEKLLNDVRKKAKEVEDHLERASKVRAWDRCGFDGYETKHIDDQASDYFQDKLDRICYEEAEKHVKKHHKLRWELEAKKEYAKNT